MTRAIAERLRSQDILPSAQRVAVAKFVLSTSTHPSAEDVFKAIQDEAPTISLATVYNTLHLFAQKGLLRELAIAEGKLVYDCCMQPHHHIVDVESGAIHDLAWSALRVERALEAGRAMGFEIDEYQVVLRGKRRGARRTAGKAKGKSA